MKNNIYFFKLLGRYEIVNNNNILVIDIQLIGDSVMLSPIFKNLKFNQDISDTVDVLCTSVQAEIYKRCDGVDNIIIDDFDGFIKNNYIVYLKKDLYKLWYAYYIFKFTLTNLINRYNILILPRWDTSSIYTAIISLLSGIKNRFTYSEKVNKDKAIRNFWRNKYFTKIYEHKADCLESDKFLDLIDMMGYKIIDREIKLNARKTIVNVIPPRTDYAVLATDTSTNRKEWDISKFLTIAEFLNSKNILPILVGVKKEKEDYFIKNAKNVQYRSLIGKTSISEIIDIIANCNIYRL